MPYLIGLAAILTISAVSFELANELSQGQAMASLTALLGG